MVHMEVDDRAEPVFWEFEGKRFRGWKFGKGHRLLLCLHGYGQHAMVFEHWAAMLSGDYTIVTTDLAFHGEHPVMASKMTWNEAFAKGWFSAFLQSFQTTTCSVMGYSIGARVSLSLTAMASQHIDELFLIAPDGAPVSATYRWLTGSTLGNWVFRRFVHKPQLAFGLIQLGKQLRMIPKRTAAFFHFEIETTSKRLQLFRTWMFYRTALPDYTILKQRAAEGQLAIVAVLGKNDAVIPYKRTSRYLAQNLKALQIIRLDAGHNLLSEKAVRKFASIWENKKGDPLDRL